MRDEGTTNKAIFLVIGTVAALIIAGVIMFMVNTSKSKANEAVTEMVKQADDALKEKYTQYDGVLVTGTTVMSALTTFKSDTIFVEVVNSTGNTTSYFYDSSSPYAKNTNNVALAQNKSNRTTTYIEPTSNFLGECVYLQAGGADTETIVGVRFTYQP